MELWEVRYLLSVFYANVLLPVKCISVHLYYVLVYTTQVNSAFRAR